MCLTALGLEARFCMCSYSLSSRRQVPGFHVHKNTSNLCSSGSTSGQYVRFAVPQWLFVLHIWRWKRRDSLMRTPLLQGRVVSGVIWAPCVCFQNDSEHQRIPAWACGLTQCSQSSTSFSDVQTRPSPVVKSWFEDIKLSAKTVHWVARHQQRCALIHIILLNTWSKRHCPIDSVFLLQALQISAP